MSDDFALDFIRNLENKNDSPDVSFNFGEKSINSESSSPLEMSEELKRYLSLLNPEQKAAVEHFGSPLLILAGAGSGKTRVITTKIAYLINQKGFSPYSILAVTFTKKAAKEMLDRAVLMEPLAQNSMIRTFHSFGSWFLRRFSEEAGIDKNFTVYDDDDMLTLLTKAVPELNKNQASQIAHLIALAKDYCYTPQSPELSKLSNDLDFPRYYELYEQRLRQTGNVDFGDLIMLPVLVLEQNENIRMQMIHRFKVILVDEYQDSNVAQFRLLKALSSVNESENEDSTYVCVVGDDDQSIYKFRGAEVQNILSFEKQFPRTTLIRLERNYRSTAKILNAADKIVSKNESRLGKTLIAERGEGKKPVLVFLPNQDEEAKFCASMILQSHKNGTPFNDWAILYRTNAQSLTFESEFLRARIPYQVVGSLKFYEREEIKDMLAFLSLIANQKDEISFRRIINKPTRGIGAVAQDKIMAFALKSGASNLVESAKNACNEKSVGLTKKAKEGVTQFCAIIDDFVEKLNARSENANSQNENSENDSLIEKNDSSKKNQIETQLNLDGSEKAQSEISNKIDSGNLLEKKSTKKKESLAEFVELIMNKSTLLEYHKAQDEIAGTQRAANMQELVNSAVLYEYSVQGLLEFLDHIELDRTLETDEETPADAVTMITLHNTKGLEFPRVVITGLERGIFPRDTEGDLEEERRLFYVGITRAKDELYVTTCAERRLYGRTNPMEVSPFLIEAGNTAFRVLGNKPLSYVRAMSTDLSGYFGDFDDFGDFGGSRGFDEGRGAYGAAGARSDFVNRKKNAPWSIGTKIFHDDYGYGQIIKSDFVEENLVILVKFETGTTKKFLPEFQKSSLTIIKD